MPTTFSASDTKVVTIRATPTKVAEALADPNRIKEFLSGDTEATEVVDPHTLHIVRKAVEEKGIRFRGDYTVRYDHHDSTVTWQTVGNSNMRARGKVQVTAIGADSSRLEYSESIECDMDANRIIAAVLRPIVEYKIKNGISDYLERVKRILER
jgi:carbon monoxide dehydrogenase subunit G